MHLANGTQGNAALRVSAAFGAQAKRFPTGTNEDVLVERVHISWTAGTALSVGGRGHLVRDCDLDDNGQNGLHVAGAQDCRFERVRWRRNNRHPGRQFDWGWEAVMKVASSQGCVFDRCESSDNQGMGFWVDGPRNQGNVLMNSVIRDNAAQGVRLEISLGTTVINNLITGNREAAIEISASAGNRIVNNTIVRNHSNALGIGRYEDRWPDGRAMSSYGNVLVNNIVVDNQRARYAKSWIFPTMPEDTSARLPVEVAVAPPYAPNRSDHNWFGFTDPAENGREFFIVGGRFKDLASYQEASGQDLHSRWGDPGFVDAPNGDWRLRRDSPARGIGSDLALDVAPHDAAGNPRALGQVDPGAWQSTH
jgi:parallel beta-helix repeat protein